MYKYARPSKPQTPNSMHEETQIVGGGSLVDGGVQLITTGGPLVQNFKKPGMAFEDWLVTCADVTKFLTGTRPDFSRWNLSSEIMRRRSEMPIYIPNGVDLPTSVRYMAKMGFDVSGINFANIIGFFMGSHDETLLRIVRSVAPDSKPLIQPTQGRRISIYHAEENYLCLLGWIYATILFRIVTGSALDSDGTFTVTPSNRLGDKCLYVGVKDGVVTTDIMRFDTRSGILGKRLVRRVKFK